MVEALMIILMSCMGSPDYGGSNLAAEFKTKLCMRSSMKCMYKKFNAWEKKPVGKFDAEKTRKQCWMEMTGGK